MVFLNDVKKDLLTYSDGCGFKNFLWALICSPGFLTIFLHRISIALYRSGGVKAIIGRLIWRINVASSGCYISLNSRIGGGCFLPHPVGIVIGNGVVVGESVTIYQGVTLGQDGTSWKYPTLMNNITIFSNSLIVGDIVVASNCIIGAMSMLNKSTESNFLYFGVPAKKIRSVN